MSKIFLSQNDSESDSSDDLNESNAFISRFYHAEQDLDIQFHDKLSKPEQKRVYKIYEKINIVLHKTTVRRYLERGGLCIKGTNVADVLNQFLHCVTKESDFIKCKDGIRYFFHSLHEELDQFQEDDLSIYDAIIEDQLSQVVFSTWKDKPSSLDSSDDIRIKLTKVYSSLIYGGIVGKQLECLMKAFTLQLVYCYEVNYSILTGLTHEILEDTVEFRRLVNLHKGTGRLYMLRDMKMRLECY